MNSAAFGESAVSPETAQNGVKITYDDLFLFTAMQTLSRGERLGLADLGLPDGNFSLRLDIESAGLTLDLACFGLDAARKLADERYMTFFNQPETPCGAVRVAGSSAFDFCLERLPPAIDALILTLAIDGEGVLDRLGKSVVELVGKGRPVARFDFGGELFSGERALMLIEIYRKQDQWRLSPVGQGFNGGLDALVRHFGGDLAEPAAEPPPASLTAKVSLEKRLEKEAPQLLPLVRKAAVSLEKAGLSAHRARVCLCLDISGSMHSLYKSGAVQRFAERILAIGILKSIIAIGRRFVWASRSAGCKIVCIRCSYRRSFCC